MAFKDKKFIVILVFSQFILICLSDFFWHCRTAKHIVSKVTELRSNKPVRKKSPYYRRSKTEYDHLKDLVFAVGVDLKLEDKFPDVIKKVVEECKKQELRPSYQSDQIKITSIILSTFQDDQ